MATKLPQFVPILTSFTARVAGCEYDELLMSGGKLARAIAEAQLLVGHDGVLCFYDPLLLVAACLDMEPEPARDARVTAVQLRPVEDILQTRPFARVLEAIPPLRHQLPRTASIFATFAGPGLLFSELMTHGGYSDRSEEIDPDYMSDAILSITRSSLEAKADGIALIERVTATTPPELLSLYKTVRKIADFYDSAFLMFLLLDAVHSDAITQAHCVFDLASRITDDGLIVGRVSASCASNTVPMTTAGDVPAATSVEELRALRARAVQSSTFRLLAR